jgi:hypothetical protein
MRAIRRVFPKFEGLEEKALTSGLAGHTGHADDAPARPSFTEEYGRLTGTWTLETTPGVPGYRQVFTGEGVVEPLPGRSTAHGLIDFPPISVGGPVSGSLGFSFIRDPREWATVLITGKGTPGQPPKIGFYDFHPHTTTGDVDLTETTAPGGLGGEFTMLFTYERLSHHGH